MIKFKRLNVIITNLEDAMVQKDLISLDHISRGDISPIPPIQLEPLVI